MKLEKTSLAIGIGIGMTVAVATIVLLSLPRGNILEGGMTNQTSQSQYHPSIKIEMAKTVFGSGEHLDFVVLTNGICASPNVTISRDEGKNDEAVVVYQYVGSPISCPPPERTDQPQIRWQAKQLVQRISDDNFGGSGDSVITENAAFILKKAGNYTITASLPDGSSEMTKEFTVVETNNAVKCQPSSLCTYQLEAGNNTFPINFRFNGTITNMTADLPTETLTISIKGERAGNLQIAIPRDVVDSRAGQDNKSGDDYEFAVFLDDENVDPVEYSTKDAKWVEALGITDHPERYRIVVIPIKADTETVEIVGTFPA